MALLVERRDDEHLAARDVQRVAADRAEHVELDPLAERAQRLLGPGDDEARARRLAEEDPLELVRRAGVAPAAPPRTGAGPPPRQAPPRRGPARAPRAGGARACTPSRPRATTPRPRRGS